VFIMNIQKIEDEVLHLPKDERAALVQKIVLSFDTPSKEELQEDWLLEAKRRAGNLDDGVLLAVPGDEVLRKARALVK